MIKLRYALFGAVLASAGLPIYIHAPKYYVDEYGVSLTAIGIVLTMLRLVDVFQDPLLGRLASWLNDARAASAGIALMAMCLGMVGLFVVAPPISPLVWMAICLTVLFTGYSYLTIVFYARGVVQAQEFGEGGHEQLAGWRETGALIGVSTASVAPFLFPIIGIKPFTGFAFGFVMLALVGGVFMHKIWPAKLVIQPTGFLSLLRDKGILRLLTIGFFNALPVAVTSTLFLFFVQYRLGAESYSGAFLLLFFLAAAASAPLWSIFAQTVGTRRVLALGMVLAIATFIGAYFLKDGDLAAFAVVCLLSGAALGADMTLLPALFARKVEASKHDSAQAFGIWNFASKLTLALAAALVLPALAQSGFRAGVLNTEPALVRLSLLYALVPCGLKLIALCLLYIQSEPSAANDPPKIEANT